MIKDLSKPQIMNIEALIIKVVNEALKHRTIDKEEYGAIRQFCIQGASAITILAKFKSGEYLT